MKMETFLICLGSQTCLDLSFEVEKVTYNKISRCLGVFRLQIRCFSLHLAITTHARLFSLSKLFENEKKDLDIIPIKEEQRESVYYRYIRFVFSTVFMEVKYFRIEIGTYQVPSGVVSQILLISKRKVPYRAKLCRAKVTSFLK